MLRCLLSYKHNRQSVASFIVTPFLLYSMKNKIPSLIVFFFMHAIQIQQVSGMEDKTAQQYSSIPRLSELAFNAAKPILIKQITAITKNKSLDLDGKLHAIDFFMKQHSFAIAFLTLHHPGVIKLINQKAQHRCQCIKKGLIQPGLPMPNLDEIINRAFHYFLLKEEYASLPKCSPIDPFVYAACILNNGFLFGPIHTILQKIYPKDISNNVSSIMVINNNLMNKEKKNKNTVANNISTSLRDFRTIILPQLCTENNIALDENVVFSGQLPSIYTPSDIEFCSQTTTSYADISTKSGQEQLLLTEHFNLVYSADRKKIAVNNINHVRIDLLDNPHEPIIFSHDGSINNISFSVDGNTLFMANKQMIFICDLIQPKDPDYYRLPPHLRMLAFCPINNHKISIATTDNTNNILQIIALNIQQETSKSRYSISVDDGNTTSPITTASFSPDGKMFAIGCDDGTLMLINRKSQRIYWSVYHFDKTPVNKITFSNDSSIIMTLIHDSTVCLWHIPSGRCIKQFCLEQTNTIEGKLDNIITIPKRDDTHANTSTKIPVVKSYTEKLTSYIPLVLLNLPIDKESLCIENETETIWKKALSINELILERMLNTCKNINDLQQLHDALTTSTGFSPHLKTLYSMIIASKIEELHKKEEDRKQREQERKSKIDRATRAFLLYMPQWTVNHTFKTFSSQLDQNTKSLIFEKICKTQNLFALFFTYPKDMFIATMQKIIPQYELKPRIEFSESHYAHYKDGYPEYKQVILHPAPMQQISQQQEMTPTNEAQLKIFEKNTIEAFCALAEYAQQKLITITDLVEDPSSQDSCSQDNMGYFYGGIFQDQDDLTRSYGLSLNDFLHTNAQQRALLAKIAEGHNAGKQDFEKRYKMTQNDIDLLLPILDNVIDKNDLYKYLQIGIAFEPKTQSEELQAAAVTAIPLALAEGIIPYILYNNIQGKLQGAFGGIASCGLGFAIGQWIFPLFDMLNPHALKLHKWFGYNRKLVHKREPFAALALLHMIIHTAAQKVLIWQTLPYQALGYTLHGIRLLSYICSICDVSPYLKNKGLLHTFARMFYLEKDKHPLERRNRDDKSYTLGDLLRAQKIWA